MPEDYFEEKHKEEGLNKGEKLLVKSRVLYPQVCPDKANQSKENIDLETSEPLGRN